MDRMVQGWSTSLFQAWQQLPTTAPARVGRAFSIHTFSGFLGTAVAPVTMLAVVRSGPRLRYRRGECCWLRRCRQAVADAPDAMWMGGNAPLGYDASERSLAANPAEAETVRCIFALYRELGCVRRVKEEADRLGLRTKHSTTASGTERGGRSFSRGHIYHLLSNPIYIGEIAHKGQLYPGQHPALIDAETWTAVRDSSLPTR